MNKYELVELIEEAQECLNECVIKLQTYCDATGDENARAYLLDHLKIKLSDGHGFLSSELNFDVLKNRVMNDSEEE